jgi:hypothetical protein
MPQSCASSASGGLGGASAAAYRLTRAAVASPVAIFTPRLAAGAREA